jgi:23S rRNA (cytosine1962-C5)-methyltransferase
LLGVGFYNSRSKINVRVLAPERVEVNESFFEDRIRAALAVRQKHLPHATSFRVVNAESDFLSGLIVDKYEDALVVQISSLGMDQRKAMIVAALQKIFFSGPGFQPGKTGGTPVPLILERSDIGSRKFEGLQESNGILFSGSGLQPDDTGKMPVPLISVNLNGLKFETDLAGGHKTGMYLDQQMNYQAVAQFAKGAQVLDCFSFLGGFGLHAARAGAAHVHLLDQSADAIEASKRNAAANGLAEKCSFDTINVFDWLKANTAVKPHERVIPRFDLIILDPPSFTRNRASVPDALRGYKEIHLRALKLLKTGGTLATFCCSHHVSAELFLDSLLSAAFDTRKILRRVATYAQSPDHPIIPMIPETEYLKGFAFEVVR